MQNVVKTLPSKFLLVSLDAYRALLSPWLGSACRFYPSCSQYAREAVVMHGAAHGTWLALKRVCRCHPWHPGGVDLVPALKTESTFTHHA